MNEMSETIKKHGIDSTAQMLTEYVNQKIQSEDVAMQFILEELEAASQGSDIAKQFALNSGFYEDDYSGAMNNSFEEVDGPNGPQQEILNLCRMLHPNQQQMNELRLKTVDNIMKEWKLGKYAAINNSLRLINVVKKIHNLAEGVFANINNDLNEFMTDDVDILHSMAYGYARRTTAAALYLQGVFNKESYQQASNIFKSLQLKTGQSIEFQEEASLQAIELLLSYDDRLNKNFIVKLIKEVEFNQIESSYEDNEYFSDEYIFEIFHSKAKTKIIYDKYGNKYKEVISPYTGRTWLDRNLGAKRIATSYDDKDSYGDYFQWGRNSDGHEKVESEITNSLSETNQPNHSNFILPIDDSFNWLTSNEENLWNGLSALNNPCPEGYRLPTLEELVEETIFPENNNIYDVYNNFLKIPAAGCRNNLDGELYFEGEKNFLWTSDTFDTGSIFLSFNEKTVSRNASFRAAGANIRCIKDY